MDFFFKGMSEGTSECPFDENSIQRCPFLRNINKPTSFAFSSASFLNPLRGGKGPIFEDGPNFDSAFKLFHGKDGVVPLESKSTFRDEIVEAHAAPQFNPLAARAATISLSPFGPAGPFGFQAFNDKLKKLNKKPELSNPKELPSQKGDISKHEALGNEWLQTGQCPMAKSYRAVSRVLPLVAHALKPPAGVKFKCPPAIVAARAALARTAFVKNLRPQPLPSKMLVIALLGMAVNVPLGVWREHTVKFSISWFAAIHAAVPFIAMLRKSVNMPKAAMALTIGASVLGQVIGSRAERYRLLAIAQRNTVVMMERTTSVTAFNSSDAADISGVRCGIEGTMWESLPVGARGPSSSSGDVCY